MQLASSEGELTLKQSSPGVMLKERVLGVRSVESNGTEQHGGGVSEPATLEGQPKTIDEFSKLQERITKIGLQNDRKAVTYRKRQNATATTTTATATTTTTTAATTTTTTATTARGGTAHARGRRGVSCRVACNAAGHGPCRAGSSVAPRPRVLIVATVARTVNVAVAVTAAAAVV